MKFVCSHCDKVLKVGADKVGRRGKCPHCKTSITVPTEAEAAARLVRRKAPSAGEEQPDFPFEEFVVYDVDHTELIYDAASSDIASKRSLVDYRKVAVPRSMLYLQGVLLGLVALAAFTLGVLVGLNLASEESDEDQLAGACLVTGRVAYRNGAHERRPDAGAVVIMLPKDARPEKQAAPYGLRPQDEFPDDNHPGLWTIREIGGDYGRTDENGQYRLRVKNLRAYYLLVISNKVNRPRGDEMAKSHLAQIGSYFLPAQDLVGRNKYELDQVASIRGTQQQLRDIIFE